MVGAQLSLEWIEHRIVNKRLKTWFEQRNAVSAAKGHFRFCGLPDELTGSLSASFGGDTTAKVAVRVDPVLASRKLYVAPRAEVSTINATRAAASPTGGPTFVRRTSSVTGKVVNSKGQPISLARVAIDRSEAIALTGEDGRFVFRGVRPGTRAMNVRRLGFEPVEIPVDVSSDVPPDVTIRLADFVPTLDTIFVSAMRPQAGLDRVGFSRRKKAGMGIFIEPATLQSIRAGAFVDLFSSVPMLRRVSKSNGREKLVGRPQARGPGCINYFVDGVSWLDIKEDETRANGIEDFITPSEVGAIEVYAGAFVPSSFVRGLTDCDMTVAIWTKPKLGIR